MKNHRVGRLTMVLGLGVVVIASVVPSGALGVSGDDTITRFAGIPKRAFGDFSGDGGPALRAELDRPVGLAVDAQGNVYIADRDNQRVRKVDTRGIISTFAGSGDSIDRTYGDGGPATAAGLFSPVGVAVDRQGNVYIAERGLNGRVRKVNASGVISTYAGGGNAGYPTYGDGGPATSADLRDVSALALDVEGNVYVSDYNDGRVRKVSRSGIITTVAGRWPPGFSGDGGPATSAQLQGPTGLAFDGQGNLYIADQRNGRIRRVSRSGIITTVAGGGQTYPGPNGLPARSALVANPFAVAVDRQGSLYTASGRLMYKISGERIALIAGEATAGPPYSGDNGPAHKARFTESWGMAIDRQGSLYFSDIWTQTVRKISATLPPTQVTGVPSGTVLVNGKAYAGGPISLGSRVDVTRGRVTLTTNVGTLTAAGGGGITAQFVLRRARAAGKPVIELRLTGGDFKACAKRTAQSRNAGKTVRRVWAKGSGKFRTRGRYASGTVRGTDWLTADRCDGTFVKTRQGVVAVLDLVLKKTVLVKAGRSYLAKKP